MKLTAWKAQEDHPPGGMGWIPLSASEGGERWRDVRAYGGKLYGLLCDDAGPGMVVTSFKVDGPQFSITWVES